MKLQPRQPKESARDYAVRMIRDNIISLDLEPGCIVSEKELSSLMGLSRTPVREALIDLSKSGIVDIFPQHGSMVSRIDYEQIEEAGFMRESMEVAVVALACEMATEEDFHYFDDNLMLQEATLARGDGPGLLAHDNEFHGRLFSLCRKNRCYGMLKSMSVHFDRVRQMSLVAMKNSKVVEDHRLILSAVRARDPERAKEVMHAHLTRYKVDRETLRQRYNEYFKE